MAAPERVQPVLPARFLHALGVVYLAANSSRAAVTAISDEIRALSSVASTSSWYSGTGLSASRMPASSA